ncbi:hypothetical protein ACWC24_32970 [Streptomyces sp. NPDC001443]
MALTLLRPDYDVWKPGEHNGTFRGYTRHLSPIPCTGVLWSDGALQDRISAGGVRTPRLRRDGLRGTDCPHRAGAAWPGGCPSVVRARLTK